MDILRQIHPVNVHPVIRIPLILAGSYQVGLLARRARLPVISGYLLTGIITGPYVLGLSTTDEVYALNFVDSICLACIAVAAGAEMNVSELTKTMRSVTALTLSITASSWILTYIGLLSLADYVPFMRPMDLPHRINVASLAATVSVARSPASAIAVLREVDGRGPFCSLTLNVVVMKDVLVIVMLALNLEVVKLVDEISHTAAAEAGTNPFLQLTSEEVFRYIFRALVLPILGVVYSCFLGVLGGMVLVPVLHQNRVLRVIKMGNRVYAGVVLLVAASVFVFARLTEGEPLLAGLTMGLYCSNQQTHSIGFRRARGGLGEAGGSSGGPSSPPATAAAAASAGSDRELIEAVLAVLMPGVNLAFFSFAGSSLALNVMAANAHVSLVLFAVRIVSLVIGAGLGSRLAGCPHDYARISWMGYVTQAGVALGLIKTAAAQHPDWGMEFSALTICVVICNTLVGPPLFKSAIIYMGEAKREAYRLNPKAEQDVSLI